ncbi:TPA: RHS repeat-associated core domain-containing protein, partial [Salmonella enterica]
YWLYEPGALTPGARYEKGQLHYVVRDHMGTPRELLTESGEVVWAQKLSVWGRSECYRFGGWNAPNDESGPGCPWRFAGQWEDEESGLYHNRFRYYDSEAVQYLTPDPIGLRGGINNYAYAPNPLGYIDPLGLCKTDVGNSYPGPKLPDNIASTFENGIYTNRKLTQDEFFYKYHGVDNRTGRKYSWLTNKLYTSEDTLRQDLAIRHDWGVNITDVSKFRVPQGTWVSEGTAAAQGAGYPGGGYQAVISNVPDVWVTNTTGVPW